DPDFTNPPVSHNGRIEASVTYNGLPVTGTDLDDYVFTWYRGVGTSSPVIASENEVDILGLPAGDYTVVATNAVLGCSSTSFSVKIGNTIVKPAVAINVDAIQTSCDENNPNGQLTASITGVASDHLFEWFEGDEEDSIALGSTVGSTSGTYGEIAQG